MSDLKTPEKKKETVDYKRLPKWYWAARVVEVTADLEASRASGHRNDATALAAFVAWMRGKECKAKDY